MMAYGSSLEQGLARALNLLDFVVWETGRRGGKIATLELHDLRSADHPVPFGACPIPVEYVRVPEAVRVAPTALVAVPNRRGAQGDRPRAAPAARPRPKYHNRPLGLEGEGG